MPNNCSPRINAFHLLCIPLLLVVCYRRHALCLRSHGLSILFSVFTRLLLTVCHIPSLSVWPPPNCASTPCCCCYSTFRPVCFYTHCALARLSAKHVNNKLREKWEGESFACRRRHCLPLARTLAGPLLDFSLFSFPFAFVFTNCASRHFSGSTSSRGLPARRCCCWFCRRRCRRLCCASCTLGVFFSFRFCVLSLSPVCKRSL